MKISEKKLNLLHILAVISMMLAVVHTAWWGICAVSWRTSYGSAEIVAVVCLGIGILWIWKTKQKLRFVRDCRKYFVSLEGCSRISVDEFAVMVKDRPAKVHENLTAMISRGYIEGVILNVRDDYITVPSQEKPKANMRPVTCEACCGVTMLPVNSEGICDYCGSRIKS